MSVRRPPRKDPNPPSQANLTGKKPFRMQDGSVIYSESRERAEDFFKRAKEARFAVADKDKFF